MRGEQGYPRGAGGGTLQQNYSKTNLENHSLAKKYLVVLYTKKSNPKRSR